MCGVCATPEGIAISSWIIDAAIGCPGRRVDKRSLHWFFTTTSKQRKLMTLEESSTVHCHWKVVGREHNIVLTLPFPLLLPSSSSPSPIHSLPLLFLPSSPSPPSFLSPLPLPSSFRYPFSLPFPFLLPHPIYFSLYTPSSILFLSYLFLPPYSPSAPFFSLYPRPLSPI